MSVSTENRRLAAAQAYKDILGSLRTEAAASKICSALDGKSLALLLEKNFAFLDPNGNGITKEEIARAMLMTDRFAEEELVMLRLLGKYFDTIANMSDDQPGKETVITSVDKDVLSQFLMHSDMTLEQLHEWREIARTDEGSE